MKIYEKIILLYFHNSTECYYFYGIENKKIRIGFFYPHIIGDHTKF